MKQYLIGIFTATCSAFVFHISPAQCHSKPVLIIIGTRPEGIKMIPVYYELQKASIPAIICSTGQHADLLDDVFTIFNTKPNIQLNIMKPGQDLFYLTTALLAKMKETLELIKPSLVLVQGDTTSAMAGAIAAFYLKIPVGHIEAGLRTGNIYAPFPEEINRKLISSLATYHFAPTKMAEDNLLRENIDKKNIFLTGNTVIDALNIIQNKIHNNDIAISEHIKTIVAHAKSEGKTIMLLTAHRRESFDGGLANIFSAIKQSLEIHQNLFIIYPMHPNPAIKEIVEKSCLSKSSNIAIISPLSYSDLIYVLEQSNFVATDSGGIQEEATSLCKSVIVLRNETDRIEGVIEGYAYLAGTNEEKIKSSIDSLINNSKRQHSNSIYGDGSASKQIVNFIKTKFYNPEG